MATKNIVPNDNGEGGIGVTGKRWNTAFINTITGNVTGNVSGTAATVTGAAQSNITSLGTLTGLNVTGAATFNDSVTLNGSRYLVQRSNDDSSIAFANNASGTPSSHVWAVGLNYSNSNAFTIAYGSSGIPSLESSKLVMTTSGNVGIGTDSPQNNLTIQTATDVRVGIYGGAGYSGIQSISDNNNVWKSLRLDGSDIEFRIQDVPKLTISSGGNVGIGVSALSAERLTVDGMTSGNTTFSMLARNSSLTTSFWIRDNGDGYLRANAWIYGSDLRLKENISDVENGIDMVSKMKPKHFDYINGSKENLGFIAQDVQKIIPQAVSITDQEKGTLGLKTDFLVPYLVKAIQEQQTIIEDLKSRIETLEG